MFDRRALPGTAAGVLGLACALGAMASASKVLLLLAAIFTVISVVLVLTAPDVPLRYRDRKARQTEAERLAQEADQMAARAARFEAEAITAREQLAAAMRATVSPGAGSGSAEAPGTTDADLDAPDAPETGDDALLGPLDPRASAAPALPPVPAPEPVNPEDLITDRESGLFNQVFFDASLEKRISAARRGLRPLTVALVEVRSHLGEPEEADAAPKQVAQILTATLREADTVARTADGLFAVLLEDTPENGAIWTLERVRRRITEEVPDSTVRAGMSCYPAYAFDANQIVTQAAGALAAAQEWRQDRIEVTTAHPDV